PESRTVNARGPVVEAPAQAAPCVEAATEAAAGVRADVVDAEMDDAFAALLGDDVVAPPPIAPVGPEPLAAAADDDFHYEVPAHHPEPIHESVPEPIPEPVHEPVHEPIPEPIPEPIEHPMPEP